MEGDWGCWGWVKAFLLQRIKAVLGEEKVASAFISTAGDAIYACS